MDPEEQLAELFESLVELKLGITPRARTRKDVTDGTDLRVDFVYEDASPDPMALEVTSIPLGELIAAHRAGDRWSRELDEAVRSEDLGRWVVHFSAHTNIRDMSGEILDILRSKPDEHTLQDAARRFTLKRRPPEIDDEAGVYFMGVSTGVFAITGFSRELLGVALSNAAKLQETRPRQTHLMVHVGLHMSQDPTNTLVPPSPDRVPPLAAIDWIWVTFHAEPGGIRDREWVWWARPGDDDWETHRGEL